MEHIKTENNFLFGMKKWKGVLVKRPLNERSEIVQELYRTGAVTKTAAHGSLITVRVYTHGLLVRDVCTGWAVST